MRSSDTTYPEQSKKISRIKYANRQIDKFIKTSLKNKGCLRFKELIEIHDYYNIKVYG